MERNDTDRARNRFGEPVGSDGLSHRERRAKQLKQASLDAAEARAAVKPFGGLSRFEAGLILFCFGLVGIAAVAFVGTVLFAIGFAIWKALF